MPTLLLWGEEDEFQPIGYVRRYEQKMPRARLATVPGARHIPMEDDPEQTGNVLDNFFAETSAQDRSSKMLKGMANLEA